MSIRSVVTRGFGSYGTIPLVVVRGFGAESGAVVTPTTPTDHAGDGATADEIRRLERAARDFRKAREASFRERGRREARLASLVEKTYRRVILNEPEAAAEIAASPVLLSPEALKAAVVGDLAMLDAVAVRLAEWLRQQQRLAEYAQIAAELADEDDIETLLLLMN